MSIDLARTLHENVDSGPAADSDGTSGFDLDALTARVRRRRTRRAVTRAAVGVGAAGAFAFAGMQVVGRRGPDDVLPAADPAAAPGTCGSAVGRLGQSPDASASVMLPATPPAGRAVPAMRGSTDGGEPIVVTGRRVSLGLQVGPYSTEQYASGTARFHIDDDLPSRTRWVVAHQGTVVGSQSAVRPTDSMVGVYVDEDGHPSMQTSGGILDLTTCATAAAAGGVALPDGSYQLYAIELAASPMEDAAVLGGPWPLELRAALPAVTGLPDRYPADEVPVVGTALYDVFELDGVAAAGWVLQSETDSNSALDAATDAVVAAGGTLVTSLATIESERGIVGLDTSERTLSTAHWDVKLSLSAAPDGTPLLRYRLEPR
ncbi:hypothetical protein ACTHAM_001543 [Cellulomonas soli]|uniref:hypothetical protein n=1 Tax=Cellulomonas soli TaxID=931535 RepID=UPI003F87DD31